MRAATRRGPADRGIDLMRHALEVCRRGRLAQALLLPLRREVCIFGSHGTPRCPPRTACASINARLQYREARRGPPVGRFRKDGSKWLCRARRRAQRAIIYEGLAGELGDLSRPSRRALREHRVKPSGADLKHDAQCGRHIGRLPHGKEAGLFADAGRGRALHAAHRPLLETIPDLRRAPAILQGTLGGAAGATQPLRSRQAPGSHDRLLRLEQGWRLSHRALGNLPKRRAA